MNELSSQTLLSFLLSIERGERPASHLYFLGDIFDFWVGDHAYFYKRFKPLVDSIRKIRERKIQVEYFEGNHDLHLKKFWQEQYDIPVWTSERYVDLGGLIVRLEHGDLINKDDHAYLKFRSFVRHSVMEKVAYNLPGRGLQAIGSYLSHKSRERSSVVRKEQESKIREMIRNHAVMTYSDAPFDAIVTGHMHVKDDFKFKVEGKDVRSLNLGSWFEKPTALNIESRPGEFKFSWVDLADVKNSARKPERPEIHRG